MTCKACAYSALQLAENGKPGGGMICRANPPTPFAVPVPAPGGVSLQVVTLWPIVQAGDICGGFEPIEGAQPEKKPN